MTQQTQCEKLGYRVGDQFVYTGNETAFSPRAIIELYKITSDDCPLFKLISGSTPWNHADGRPGAFVRLDCVIPLQKPADSSSPSDVLWEAREIIYGEREKTHGEPGKNLRHIAEQWALYLEQRHGQKISISPEDVCYMMADLKKCRQMNSSNRDNLVGGCGYIGLIERL